MATATIINRPPLPPFTRETAIQKVRLAEDGWNTRAPQKLALAYAIDSRWRNRSEFITDETKSLPSCRASGARSWITDSSRNCGLSPLTALPCDLFMSDAMSMAPGFAPAVTKTGCSTRTRT